MLGRGLSGIATTPVSPRPAAKSQKAGGEAAGSGHDADCRRVGAPDASGSAPGLRPHPALSTIVCRSSIDDAARSPEGAAPSKTAPPLGPTAAVTRSLDGAPPARSRRRSRTARRRRRRSRVTGVEWSETVSWSNGSRQGVEVPPRCRDSRVPASRDREQRACLLRGSTPRSGSHWPGSRSSHPGRASTATTPTELGAAAGAEPLAGAPADDGHDHDDDGDRREPSPLRPRAARRPRPGAAAALRTVTERRSRAARSTESGVLRRRRRRMPDRAVTGRARSPGSTARAFLREKRSGNPSPERRGDQLEQEPGLGATTICGGAAAVLHATSPSPNRRVVAAHRRRSRRSRPRPVAGDGAGRVAGKVLLDQLARSSVRPSGRRRRTRRRHGIKEHFRGLAAVEQVVAPGPRSSGRRWLTSGIGSRWPAAIASIVGRHRAWTGQIPVNRTSSALAQETPSWSSTDSPAYMPATTTRPPRRTTSSAARRRRGDRRRRSRRRRLDRRSASASAISGPRSSTSHGHRAGGGGEVEPRGLPVEREHLRDAESASDAARAESERTGAEHRDDVVVACLGERRRIGARGQHVGDEDGRGRRRRRPGSEQVHVGPRHPDQLGLGAGRGSHRTAPPPKIADSSQRRSGRDRRTSTRRTRRERDHDPVARTDLGHARRRPASTTPTASWPSTSPGTMGVLQWRKCRSGAADRRTRHPHHRVGRFAKLGSGHVGDADPAWLGEDGGAASVPRRGTRVCTRRHSRTSSGPLARVATISGGRPDPELALHHPLTGSSSPRTHILPTPSTSPRSRTLRPAASTDTTLPSRQAPCQRSR